ncbi:MAG: hypothetical protein KatS3mg101_0668 [Patescibacteria group bacterium]|nr:MAG: hypothetical protein KatS3mg101_0668 [Patescibacteria group bacterium]
MKKILASLLLVFFSVILYLISIKISVKKTDEALSSRIYKEKLSEHHISPISIDYLRSLNIDSDEPVVEEMQPIGMANPASVNCQEDGGRLEMITNSDGSQFALCVFENYACEEWAYFRNECDIEGDAEK